MANEAIYVISCTRKYGPCVDMEEAESMVQYLRDSQGGESKDYPIVKNEAEYQAVCEKHREDLARSRETVSKV